MVAALIVYGLIADRRCDPRQQLKNTFVGLAFGDASTICAACSKLLFCSLIVLRCLSMGHPAMTWVA